MKHSQFGGSVVSAFGVGAKSRGADGGHRGSVRSGAEKSAGTRLERAVAVVLSIAELSGFVAQLQATDDCRSHIKCQRDRARQENPGCRLGPRRPLVAEWLQCINTIAALSETLA